MPQFLMPEFKKLIMFSSTKYGEVVWNGRVFRKDLIVFSDRSVKERSREYARERYGTSHHIDARELEGFLDREAQVFILGKGQDSRSFLDREARELLKRRGIEFVEAGSPEAIGIYNKTQKKACAMIHITC
jgi:hypothetical protein